MEGIDRIVRTPGVMGGRPRIRGRRVTVANILGQIAAGYGIDDILLSYPYLDREDIQQAILYAASLAEAPEIELAKH